MLTVRFSHTACHMCVPTSHYFNMPGQTFGPTHNPQCIHVCNGSNESSEVDDCKNHFACKLLELTMRMILMDVLST